MAAILKRLDNVVKEYSSATANMFTAVLCSFLFPEKFSFTVYIVFAMVLLFIGIYMYEMMKTDRSNIIKSSMSKSNISKSNITKNNNWTEGNIGA
jgi:hypothetical protein